MSKSNGELFFRDARALLALAVLGAIVYFVFFLEFPSGLTLWEAFLRAHPR